MMSAGLTTMSSRTTRSAIVWPVHVLGLFGWQCYVFLLRVTELSALLTQSQKQNEDYEKMVKALRETMEILVCYVLLCIAKALRRGWQVSCSLWTSGEWCQLNSPWWNSPTLKINFSCTWKFVNSFIYLCNRILITVYIPGESTCIWNVSLSEREATCHGVFEASVSYMKPQDKLKGGNKQGIREGMCGEIEIKI